MANDTRPDHSHLPPATPDEIRLLLRRAGLDLPEDLLPAIHRRVAFLRGDGPPHPAQPPLRRGAGAQLPPVPLLLNRRALAGLVAVMIRTHVR